MASNGIVLRHIFILLTTVVLCATAPVSRAAESGESWDLPRSIGQIILTVYGTNAQFSAMAHSLVQHPARNQAVNQHMLFYFKGGQFTAHYDVPIARDASKLGMTYIYLRDLNKAYLLANGPPTSDLAGGCSVPLPETLGTNVPLPKVEKKTIDRQTVDGHPCTIVQAVAKLADGSKLDVLLWEASDLHRFPVRIQSELNGAPVTTTFDEIKIERQPEGRFDVGILNPKSQYFENPQDMINDMTDNLLRWKDAQRRKLDKEMKK